MEHKKMILAGIIFLCAVSGISAQQAVIRDLAGTVEIKRAGATAWEPARQGQFLTGDTAISTGFRSTAVITLGNSVLVVRPLTRLTLAELSRMQDTEKVELNLQTGRVRADVKPPEGAKTEFTVRSSAATASVRGTVFEFDTYNLTVNEGTVEFVGALGASVLIDAGGISYTGDTTGRAIPPEETAAAELKPDLPIASNPLPEERPVQGETVKLFVTVRF